MSKPIVRVVTATEAKNRFGDIIKRVYLREEHLIVNRDGIPVVAIVPIADYERLASATEEQRTIPADIADELAASTRAARARARLLEVLEDIHKKMPDVSEEEAEADIQEAIREVRAAARSGKAD